MDEQEPVLLTATAAGKILGVHPVTITRWARAGRLPYVVVPPLDRWMYVRQEIEQLAELRPRPSRNKAPGET